MAGTALKSQSLRGVRAILAGRRPRQRVLGAVLAVWASVALGQDIPRIVSEGGRHALYVDGAPFLVLGAQANNSSNYPEPLGKVWPVIERLGANTLEIPVAWEQVEPVEGQFDFAWLDTLLAQARAHDKRLILLWFATWKNTAPAYAPRWVKLDNARFPRMITPTGASHYALSPHARSTLDADRRAFVKLMEYLRDKDSRNTVIMVQVENEPGSYGLVRDHGPEAQRLFAGPVPEALRKRLGRKPGTWREVFGADADEFFQAWAVASHINAVAAAGKAIKPLPMYSNAALAAAAGRQSAATYASGGPVHHVIDIYKAAAPALDLVAPDIYTPDESAVAAYLDFYARRDNPLLVPEIGNSRPFARYFFDVIGHGGIGFAPFGMDATGYANYPLGARSFDEALDLFARIYRLFGPMQREWAKAAAEGKVWGVSEPVGAAAGHQRTIQLGPYRATVSFGRHQFGFDPPTGNPEPTGGAAIAQLGPDEYLVTGFDARVEFALAEAKDGKATGESLLFDRVEEGRFEGGRWIFARVWNGDQVDYGLNFTGQPQVLRVKLARLRTARIIPVGNPN
ncbi:DUF5597 domain-containing protein [Novosphingobium piscinae]|uniref:DUF5597 domain-containing protein n=1 Tax=Novosphingobium piscinae TaxID=1507448 RepID=A0A7X1FZZ5_9SPHN|nr:DUF5597 domain-containing protein [Novosphingobium piscinae]MBC2670114.1 DUF5597 domain-containing protein [Novosphingobium piscinae]